MDFSRLHILEDSVATKSKIRYIPVDLDNTDGDGDNNSNNNNHKTLDHKLIDAANRAAKDLLLGPVQNPDLRRIDAALYPERITPQSETIQAHQLVVIFESFDNLKFVYAQPGAIFSNRNGHLLPDDVLVQPFGCKILSRNDRGYGYC